MSKNVAMFVDVANLYYAARGQDVDVDYVTLLKHATKGRDLIRAYAYSGLDPENENQRKFIDFLGKNGYKVIHKDIRKFGDGRVKANLDIELVVDLFRLRDRMDIAVIVSGDGDFAPAIRALQDEGVRCEVISFRPNTSSDLIAVADEFIDIMKVIGIGRGRAEAAAKTEKGMSAPEMPAKEVVPEFGFREASPGVAAAALAALRSGEPRGGRGRRAPGRAAEPVAEAPVGAATSGVAVSTGEAATAETERRRRRRRGGRGRGRGRGRAEGAGAPEPGAEIGWREVDDLSELEGLGEEREYTFEEADAATLAELGLLDAEHTGEAPADVASEVAATASEVAAAASRVAAAVEPAEEQKPRPARRRPARRKAAEGAAEEHATEAVAESGAKQPARGRASRKTAGVKDASQAAKTPARRRTSRAASAAGDSQATGQASTDEKPARGRGGRKAKGDAVAGGPGEAGGSGEPAEGEEPQGIWQRFRSARGS